MNLQTPLYLLSLLIFTLIYWRLPVGLVRQVALVVISYLCYALFDPRFALLLAGLSIVIYFIGRGIISSTQRFFLATIGVILNLSVLIIFKYSGFFLESLRTVLAPWGITSLPVAFSLLLPIGISFYTFQGISYIVGVYRKKLTPASFFDLMLYLAFFPKLIAGPIVSPKQFFDELHQLPDRLANSDRSIAFKLLLSGLVKKVLIADSLTSLAGVAFRAAGQPGNPSFPTLLFIQGFYLYAIQIYADFSGYTDLARGSALLLGFHLPENFRQPYLSGTIADFWNRWHMSLTAWFREYLFFPLSRSLLKRSGQRWSRQIQVVTNLITMILIGFWHGTNWTFVVWSVWHGLLVSIERITAWKPQKGWQTLLSTLITFHLVAIGWVLFKSADFASAFSFFAGMTNLKNLYWIPNFWPPILLAGGLMAGLDFIERGSLRYPARVRHVGIITAVVVLTGLTILSAVRGSDVHPFIYGNF
ncbi:MAG TPA: MBOAT family O-acyltransferase [Anaerolineaceae bacterium]|nr:MBOAT family O-acyltransferase [Anaerolineaceae bacterium]